MSVKKKTKKKTALIVCRDGKEFWTTQKQFWQWRREGIVVQDGDQPLSGHYVRPNAEYEVVINNTVLNLACRHHLQEALAARRRGLAHA